MIRKKVAKFFSIPNVLRIIIIKVFVYSIFYEIWLSTNNYKKIKSLHGLVDQDKVITYDDEELKKILFVKKAIDLLKKYAPWRPKCYNQALCARKMLVHYDIESVFSIGFKKNVDKIEGHAWIRCNKIFVSGYLRNLKSFKKLHAM